MLKRYYSTRPLRSLCVANRGEIVQRVESTASKLGIKTTTIYTEPDRDLPSATSAPVNMSLGSAPTGYIDIEKVVSVAKAAGCDSIHPGYGFLSENAQFAKRVRDEGLIFVGPPQAAIEAMGAKDRSKEIMEGAGVPCVPGYHGKNQDIEFLTQEANKIKYPVLIKAVLGGGGKGMRIAHSEAEFRDQLLSAKSEAKAAFGDDNVLIEKYITTPRHIEVQVFADKFGNTVALGERDCSVQRRHQKVLEESPAPGLDPAIRQDLWDKARAAATAVGYEGAGTVEFIFDNDTNEFFFMEMNTRLQVEHPVSELVTNTDLVEWQLLVAAGLPLPKTQEEIQLDGHAIEARIYCEDPFQQFLPSSGEIVHMQEPTTGNPRLDFTFKEKNTVSSLYDPMVGKLIIHGRNRDEALRKMYTALKELEIVGPTTNVEFIKNIVNHENFSGENPPGLETGFIPKNEADLFANRHNVPNEVFVQAAIGNLLKSQTSTDANAFSDPAANWSTIWRTVNLKNGDKLVEAKVGQVGANQYQVSIDGAEPIQVTAEYINDKKLHISFDHAQFVNSVVIQLDSVHVFHDGTHYTLDKPEPEWLVKALGHKEVENSVVAPMPCTIAKVSVQPGDAVKKDQELVTILSMKMETIVRSPADGIVKRVAHGEGDMVKQGTILVEFEDPDTDA
ncbi:hypothetical protein TRICI_000894 [Trichomonascus ciferrii]|uniref:Uncharacterized protein n=1 Tax=Trichomonascus ciferrii TaxID=44093 RepID=A0A642VBC4_9ASCO|nr:hypothetical protein TRICI_000894 [Trichomonascus ciferrii]